MTPVTERETLKLFSKYHYMGGFFSAFNCITALLLLHSVNNTPCYVYLFFTCLLIVLASHLAKIKFYRSSLILACIESLFVIFTPFALISINIEIMGAFPKAMSIYSTLFGFLGIFTVKTRQVDSCKIR